jgi:hypothetical protein
VGSRFVRGLVEQRRRSSDKVRWDRPDCVVIPYLGAMRLGIIGMRWLGQRKERKGGDADDQA